MKRRHCALLTFLLIPFCLYGQSKPQNTPVQQPAQATRPAGFGFRAGMTRGQIIKAVGKANVYNDNGDYFYLKKSLDPKANSLFKGFIMAVSDTVGLAKIVAFTPSIETSGDGTQLKHQFERISKILVTRYGVPSQHADLAKPGMSADPQHWMLTLMQNNRILASDWEEKGFSIVLEAVAARPSSGYITVIYQFRAQFQVWFAEHKRRNATPF